MTPKEKPCKGINKARMISGCNKLTMYRTFGLCSSCLSDFLFNSDAGKVVFNKINLKVKSDKAKAFKSDLREKLLQWTAKGMMHCTGILHKNFGTAKPVGHVGSSVLKKAETVVFINTEEEITTAKCEYSRNIAFNDITFKIGNDWLPREDLPEINTKNWL